MPARDPAQPPAMKLKRLTHEQMVGLPVVDVAKILPFKRPGHGD